MPYSLIIALTLLPTPDCSTALSQFAGQTHHLAQRYEELIMLSQKRHQEVAHMAQVEAPAVAEKPSRVKPVIKPYEELAIDETTDPAVASKPVDVVPEQKISEPARDTGPAIAERAPRRETEISSNLEIDESPAIARRKVEPAPEINPMDLSAIQLENATVVEHAPAVAERPKRTAKEEFRPDEWQQVAQGWPTLPLHVRSEILRLIEDRK